MIEEKHVHRWNVNVSLVKNAACLMHYALALLLIEPAQGNACAGHMSDGRRHAWRRKQAACVGNQGLL